MPKLNLYYPSERYLQRWRDAADADNRSLSNFIRVVVDNHLEGSTESTESTGSPQEQTDGA